MSEMDKERLTEIDNRSRANETETEKVREGLTELQQALMGQQQAIQQLYIQLLTQQIMSEVLPRYLAGYKVGDYTAEVEQAANADVKDPSEFKMLVSDPNFDEERFQGICKEIAQVMINMKAQAARRQRDADKPSEIVTPPNAGLRIVKP